MGNTKSCPRLPAELVDAYAKRYWAKHASALWAEGTMTERDVESFIVLCQVYGRLQRLESIPYDPRDIRTPVQHNNMLKQYQQYATRFGLIGPRGRNTKNDAKPNIAEALAKLCREPSDS